MPLIKDPSGGVTWISYTPSSRFTDNKVPGVRQFVDAITRYSGIGSGEEQRRTTTYSYMRARYDYYRRKSMGLRTVTATLPKAAGETVAPKLVTTYTNWFWAMRGRIKPQTLIHDGKTQKQTVNTWSFPADANALKPLISSKTQAVEKKGRPLKSSIGFVGFWCLTGPVATCEPILPDHRSSKQCADECCNSFKPVSNECKPRHGRLRTPTTEYCDPGFREHSQHQVVQTPIHSMAGKFGRSLQMKVL